MRVLESDNQLKTIDMEEGKKKRWRPSLTAYRALESEVCELRRKLSRKNESDDTVPVKSYRELKEKLKTVESSNVLLEEEVNRLRRTSYKLSKKCIEKDDRIEELLNRGFWDRVFNR